MGSPAVDPFGVALDEHRETESRSRAAEGALVVLFLAVQIGWIAALAYAAYVFFA